MSVVHGCLGTLADAREIHGREAPSFSLPGHLAQFPCRPPPVAHLYRSTPMKDKTVLDLVGQAVVHTQKQAHFVVPQYDIDM
jgi:hypothetical protein